MCLRHVEDLRYAIDPPKIKNDLGWEPEETFESGISKTVVWYLANMDWCNRVQDGSYRRERLGGDNSSARAKIVIQTDN